MHDNWQVDGHQGSSLSSLSPEPRPVQSAASGHRQHALPWVLPAAPLQRLPAAPHAATPGLLCHHPAPASGSLRPQLPPQLSQ